MTTRYLDLTNGNDANDGSTFALRKKTLSSAVSGLTGGDTVRVMASPAATSLGQTATWTNNSDTVTLTTAVTANIDTGAVAWTASANVTCTSDTSAYREGTACASNAIAAAFTTGLAAYKSFTATDFSAYQQISLWVRTDNTVAANVLQIKLCSDNAGVTAVNTINIPAITASYWTPVTVDTGGALGASIQSVALYAVSDPGTVTVKLDNIIACKASASADSVTLNSLIGKNNGDSTEPWFAIDSINGTTIKLGTGVAGIAAKGTYVCKYFGTTESVTTYKREPILTVTQSSSVNGTNSDSPLNIEGGWNTTDMSTQTDVTWMRVTNPSTTALNITTVSYNRVNKMYAISGGAQAFLFDQGMGHIADEIGAAASNTAIRFFQSTKSRVSNGKYFVGCATNINFGGGCAGKNNWYIQVAKIWGVSSTSSDTCRAIYDQTTAYPFAVTFAVNEIKNVVLGFDNGTGYLNDITIQNCVFSNNYREVQSSTGGMLFHFINCSFAQAAFIGNNQIFRFTKYGQTANDHRVYWDDTGKSTIQSAVDQRHTASGISWKFNPLTSNTINSFNPLSIPVARLACPANEARTVTLWARRDNTGLSMRLRLPGGQIADVASDVVSNMAEAANTWGGDGAGNPLSITFTPTEAGVVEILAEAWGGSTFSGWVDDVGVS